jgi:hypothetical protein
VLVKTPSLREFVAFGPPQRVVLRAGKIVAG